MKIKTFLINLLSFALLVNFAPAQKKKQHRQHRTSNAPFLKPKEAVAKRSIPKGSRFQFTRQNLTSQNPLLFALMIEAEYGPWKMVIMSTGALTKKE